MIPIIFEKLLDNKDITLYNRKRTKKGTTLMFKLNQQTTIIILLFLLVLKQYGVL